jgi:flagellin
VIQKAIETVSAERSKMGAYQNRLEHTINNLDSSSENISSAESRIRDVDMAKEMMNYQKGNILNQAATAMLAQANQLPQGVSSCSGNRNLGFVSRNAVSHNATTRALRPESPCL